MTPPTEENIRPNEGGILKLRMTEELFRLMATRTEEGKRINVELGEADEEGFYSPVLTVDTSDDIIATYKPAADLLAKFPGLANVSRTKLLLWDGARKRLLGL